MRVKIEKGIPVAPRAKSPNQSKPTTWSPVYEMRVGDEVVIQREKLPTRLRRRFPDREFRTRLTDEGLVVRRAK